MRTLRGWVILTLSVASLLWTTPLSAATRLKTKAHAKAAKAKQKLVRQIRENKSFVGMASWYGIQHQGKRMANGQKFNRWRLTAAHRFLPLGTLCLVTFMETGQSTIVTITDRGPFHHPERVVDLSEGAAKAIGLKPYGVGQVTVVPLPMPQPEPSSLDATLVVEPILPPQPTPDALPRTTAGISSGDSELRGH